MNLLNTIRLKISNFFYPNHSVIDQLTKQFLPKNIKRLHQLCGIINPKSKSAIERARIKAEEEETALEYDKLRKNSRRVDALKKWAVLEAEKRLKSNELALATADAMEQRNKKIEEEKIAFDEGWAKYVKKHIKKRDPKAIDFAKFLVKYDFVTDKLLDDVAVTAIFHDNKIFNFRQFRLELKRVNQATAA